MRKFLKSLLLGVLAALLMTAAATARESNIISGGTEVYGVPGGRVLYPILVEGDLPMAATMLYVECDTAVFSLEKEADGDYTVQSGSVTSGGSWLAADYATKGWRMTWFQTDNSTPDGVLCYLPLQIAEDAEMGSYPISISVSVPNTINADGELVPCTAVDGEIIIEADQPTLYTTTQTFTSGMVVDVPILLRNAPKLMGMHFVFEDNATAELVRDDMGKPICTVENALSGKGTVMENKYGTDGWQMIWYSPQAQEVNDLLITLRVRILAEAGETVDLPIAVDRRNTLDENYQMQDCVLRTNGLTAAAFRLDDLICEQAGKILNVSGQLPLDLSINDETIRLLAAAYDADGRMVAVSDVAAESDGTFVFELMAAETETISVFALDPVSNHPLCAAYIVE